MATRFSGRNPALVVSPGLEAVFLPGGQPMDFRVHNAAKLIPAGYDIVLQMHYTSMGEDADAQTEVGFTIAEASAAAAVYHSFTSRSSR